MKEYLCHRMQSHISSLRVLLLGSVSALVLSSGVVQAQPVPLAFPLNDPSKSEQPNGAPITPPMAFFSNLPAVGQSTTPAPVLPAKAPLPTVSSAAPIATGDKIIQYVGVPFASGAPAATGPVGQNEFQGDPEKEPKGAPFPSMIQGAPKPLPPLSTQNVPLNQDQVKKGMEQINQQTNARMQELQKGEGIGTPSIESYQTELQELARVQRNVRLLQAKKIEAEAAMGVYNTLYDSRREEEALRKERDRKDQEEHDAKEKEAKILAAVNAPKVLAPPVTLTPSVVAPSPVTNGVVGVVVNPTESAVQQELPLPRIVRVYGTQGSLKTTLLVPYVGEISAVAGTALPGNRKVSSITVDGVTIKDPKLGLISLGYGDSVPATPPNQLPVAGRGNPLPLSTVPFNAPGIGGPPAMPNRIAPIAPTINR